MNEEIINYLSKNLKIQLVSCEDWSSKSVTAKLILNGKVISESNYEVVNKYEHKNGETA